MELVQLHLSSSSPAGLQKQDFGFRGSGSGFPLIVSYPSSVSGLTSIKRTSTARKLLPNYKSPKKLSLYLRFR